VSSIDTSDVKPASASAAHCACDSASGLLATIAALIVIFSAYALLAHVAHAEDRIIHFEIAH
jgi:hypothetical protein